MRIIKYRVVWNAINEPSGTKILATFDTEKEAESYAMECAFGHELYIQKVYIK